ncbi:MAG: hypothetical protein ACYC66_13170 [Chloroflexota bacterium]
MTEDEILLVASLAGLAAVITLADLLLSLMRYRRRAAAGASRAPSSTPPGREAAATRGEALTRRLAAIEAATEVEQ